ncbi:MAG: AAA domain-containing protein [Proteobacteria bacterium]|nr:AAA domain-containing protein [Pseudomonadota bacterium]
MSADLTVHLSERDGANLHDKLRQTYWWIINNAVITPYYDIEFGVGTTLKNNAGDVVGLHQEMSYSSFVLIPLLTLMTARRALLVGGPGRGKTTSASLMALIAGLSKEELRRSILRGHPQLTVSDLLGAPLPSDMLKAESAADIRVAWRGWIEKRVKIIDEYNRIPTKTQSALLSLMAEGYAEMYDQYVYTGRSSWFLTANDDAGGGTFQVIEALKDRIDVVVRAVPFNSAFVDALLKRIEADKSPLDLIPAEIIFSSEELDAIFAAVLAVQIPQPVLNRLSFFLGQLDFCRMASPQFEYKSKDTLKLAHSDVAQVCNEQCPLDKKVHLCTQTENGISARAYQTCLHFAKALAYFRGNAEVAVEDLRQIVPWVFHDKLVPNKRSPFFATDAGQMLLRDRVAWIRAMIDQALDDFERHESIRQDVRAMREELDQGLVGINAKTVAKRLGRIAGLMRKLLGKTELSGPVYEDLIHLKSMHSRYQNYAQWLRENQGR